MPINYVIRAEVVDVESDTPQEEDAFLVDSNVWFWMTYTKASHGMEHWRQPLIIIYPDYINTALSAGAKLLWSGLSLAELAHLIEKKERDIFRADLKPKEFRHNYPVQRVDVVQEIQAAWGQVKTLATPLETRIDETITDAALRRFESQLVDGYDLFILESMARAEVIQVITDDGDFATIPGIRVFTGNRSVLAAACKQSRLLTR